MQVCEKENSDVEGSTEVVARSDNKLGLKGTR